MAFLPLDGRAGWSQTGFSPVRTGGETDSNHAKASAAMESLLFLLFLLLLVAASAAGLTADSRDSADWKPSDGGRRWRSRTC
ncbi:hypothetical protein ACFOW4_17660 [Micromonospora sp. GCM10011542]|uniref:hypothetical protein n=1 Tax=Micromonospora sp. GCM10011542 TaxID=3317337 RepID=UPI00361618E8